MIIRRPFSDFLNSDYKQQFISSASIREHQKGYKYYHNLESTVGIDLRVVFKGRLDLRHYALSQVGGDFFESDKFINGECLEINFSNFSAYFIHVPGLTKCVGMGEVAVLINCKRIDLPRKSPVKLECVYREIYIRDCMNSHFYILPALRYPENKEDLRKMIKWLRLKHILVSRFKVRELDNRVRFNPAYNTFMNPWWKRAQIWISQEDLPENALSVLKNPEEGCSDIYICVLDFRDMKLYSRYGEFYVVDRAIDFLPMKPLTQEIVNEWVLRENGTVKITR